MIFHLGKQTDKIIFWCFGIIKFIIKVITSYSRSMALFSHQSRFFLNFKLNFKFKFSILFFVIATKIGDGNKKH